MRENPEPYELYRHFKGRVYQVITVATDTETEEKLVIYRPLDDPARSFARPLEMFMGEVDKSRYPEEKQRHRFERISVHELEDQEAVARYGSSVERKSRDGVKIREDEILEDEARPEDGEANTGEYVNPVLLQFLDAKTYEEKLEILDSLERPVLKLTDERVVNAMALSLDLEISEGTLEEKFEEVKNCLLTLEKYECRRLR